MKFRFRFLFVVCYFTAVLLFAVHLRAASDRLFYDLYTVRAQQSRLKQQLAAKQLRVEALINPAAVYQKLDK